MITFLTALYPESRDLIAKLKLKKQNKESLYQLFEGDNVRLVITGAGMISAATAVARHFACYPSTSRKDIVVNLGVAGYAPVTESTASVGDLFLVSKITEAATGRTFYPDLLYRHSFRQMPLITVPTVCNSKDNIAENSLLDMEASACYQALLAHISPDRMFFFKVISDIAGQAFDERNSPDTLLSAHLDAVLSFAFRLHDFLNRTVFTEPALTKEEAKLSHFITELLPMTEAMSRDYNRLLSYAKLSEKPLGILLENFLSTLRETDIHGKKQAMPYFNRLKELIQSEADIGTSKLLTDADSPKEEAFYQPFFATVYAERDVFREEWQSRLSQKPVFINHYKDIFNRSHQDFAAQKKAPSLILAKKSGTLIYKGAPVCQSFGNEHFYYTSCMMNCLYHCDYCYLQGMYPSGHVVAFVNLNDYFAELSSLLLLHPVYLCISYDTDLLALEQTFSFVSEWLSFAAQHENLTLEIRTKSGNPAVFKSLSSLFTGREPQKERIIFAWTVSPPVICQTMEHGAASLPLRLKALKAAKEAGFTVRLCFDPMIFHGGWKETYAKLVRQIFTDISPDLLFDVSIGVFRISTDYLKNMRKNRPDSALIQYPFVTENGVSHYGALSEEMVNYLRQLLLNYLSQDKIFLWNGGE